MAKRIGYKGASGPLQGSVYKRYEHTNARVGAPAAQ